MYFPLKGATKGDSVMSQKEGQRVWGDGTYSERMVYRILSEQPEK